MKQLISGILSLFAVGYIFVDFLCTGFSLCHDCNLQLVDMFGRGICADVGEDRACSVKFSHIPDITEMGGLSQYVHPVKTSPGNCARRDDKKR